MNALLLGDRTLFLADTFVNEEPSAEQLAEIAAMAATSCAASACRRGWPSFRTRCSARRRGLRPSACAARPSCSRPCAPACPATARCTATPRCRKTSAAASCPTARLSGEANLLLLPNLDAANILFNVLKVTGGHGVTVGPVLLGAARPVHILTPSATVRRIVNMTALAVADAAAFASGRSQRRACAVNRPGFRRVTAGRGRAAASQAGPSNHGSPSSAARSIGSASTPQNRRPSSSNVGTPNTPRAMASSVAARNSLFTSAEAGSRAGASPWVSAARRAAIGGVAATDPHMAHHGLDDAPVRPTGDRQAQQRQRVERMHGRRVDGDAVLCANQCNVAKGPGALGFDLGRPLLAPVRQQPGEQHRAVSDGVAAAFERLRQPLEGQVGERRDRVEPEGDRLHRRGTAAATLRCIKSSLGSYGQSLPVAVQVAAKANRSCRAGLCVQGAQSFGGADIGPASAPGLGAQAACSQCGVEQRAQGQARAGLDAGEHVGAKQAHAGPRAARFTVVARPLAASMPKSPCGWCGALATSHRWASSRLAAKRAASAALNSKPGRNTSPETTQKLSAPRPASHGSALAMPPAVSSAPPWSRPSVGEAESTGPSANRRRARQETALRARRC